MYCILIWKFHSWEPIRKKSRASVSRLPIWALSGLSGCKLVCAKFRINNIITEKETGTTPAPSNHPKRKLLSALHLDNETKIYNLFYFSFTYHSHRNKIHKKSLLMLGRRRFVSRNSDIQGVRLFRTATLLRSFRSGDSHSSRNGARLDGNIAPLTNKGAPSISWRNGIGKAV